jgi:hypothetical protein
VYKLTYNCTNGGNALPGPFNVSIKVEVANSENEDCETEKTSLIRVTETPLPTISIGPGTYDPFCAPDGSVPVSFLVTSSVAPTNWELTTTVFNETNQQVADPTCSLQSPIVANDTGMTSRQRDTGTHTVQQPVHDAARHV